MTAKPSYEELEQLIGLFEKESVKQKRFEEINITLFKISHAVNVTSTLDELFRIIHLSMSQIIDTTNFFIALYDRSEDSLTFPYCVDTVDDCYPTVIEISKTSSLTAEVIRTGQPMLVTKSEILAQRAKSILKIPACTPPEIWLGVPLKTMDGVIGVMAVQSYHDPMCYDQSDTDLMVSIADQVAVAISCKRTEAELRHSNRLYRELFENGRDGFVVVDSQQRFLDANQAYCEMLGYSINELKAKKDFFAITPERWRDWEHEEIWCNRLLKTGASGIYEKELIRKDGTIFPVELQKFITKDHQGNPCHLWGIARDITDRKKAERILKEIITKNPISIQILDKEGCTLEANPSYKELFGAVPPSNYSIFNDLQLLQQGMGKFFDELKTGEVVHFPELYFNAHESLSDFPDVPAWIRTIGFPLYGISEKPESFVLMHENITERKRIERELFFKKNIIKSSSCAIATCDLEGNMTYGNPFFQKLWGFNGIEDFLGKPFRSFWLMGDQDEDIMRVLQSEGTWAGELKGIKKDGSLFDVQVSAAIVLDDSGNPIAQTSTSIDITEQKVIEAQFQQFQKTESLARMAGAIAHHFNNQLSVVIGNLELFLIDLPSDTKNRENLLRSMMAAQKATAVSRQMLIYLGQTPGKHKPIDLSRACRQNLPLFQTVIPKGIIVNVDFPDSGPIIRADEGQINQVLGNLITNAWESISNNQGTIGLAIRTVDQVFATKRFPIDWQPKHIPHACLEVSDTGYGITGMDIEKLFDPFFTTKFTGRGMGLAVVMGIVKAHGGCITVDSESGYGSTFRIYLPISMEKIPWQKEKLSLAPACKSENRGTVMLIEDEEMVRDMAKTMLTRFGYKVIEAQDGVEAVEIFQQRQNEICCVLSDLTMPRMGGWEILTAIRKIRADIPVILASGHNKDVVMAGNHPELPQAFLYKPYSMSALKEALSKAISV